jgi:hypothetical protein
MIQGDRVMSFRIAAWASVAGVLALGGAASAQTIPDTRSLAGIAQAQTAQPIYVASKRAKHKSKKKKTRKSKSANPPSGYDPGKY